MMNNFVDIPMFFLFFLLGDISVCDCRFWRDRFINLFTIVHPYFNLEILYEARLKPLELTYKSRVGETYGISQL